MRLFVISKVGNPIKLAGTSSYNDSANCYLGIVNKANGHKLGRKADFAKVFAKNVGPCTAGERKILPNELSDKIATFFIAHLFKYRLSEEHLMKYVAATNMSVICLDDKNDVVYVEEILSPMIRDKELTMLYLDHMFGGISAEDYDDINT